MPNYKARPLQFACAAFIASAGIVHGAAQADAREASYQIYRYGGNDFIVRRISHGGHAYLHAYRAAGTQWERFAVAGSARGQSYPARILRHGRRLGRTRVDLDIYNSIDLNSFANNPP
jgi:hypothetical protein